MWSWLIFLVGALYFLITLAATFYWSLRAEKGIFGFEAYRRLFADTNFLPAFSESMVNAVVAIFLSLLIIVPTAYWVTLRLPGLRPVVEFISLLPFVIPAVVLVFALIRLYSRPPLLLTATYGSSRVILVCVYAALSFPYMFRSVDNGLRAMDVRTLTEAAQGLGASWATILREVIFPNLRVALLSGALLTFAIVIGELTIALFMAQHTLGPYMANLTRSKVYEPSAMAIVAFAITWAAMGMIAYISRERKRP
ncbi:MAG: spermidine/putrescine ABC transporter permease [Chloroflexi bacterium RBG_16_58_14]|nr:MAG: spermidine/putrescine ABC transporter permease [Chloroflexi bacterium RBG_16_58_14]